VLPKWAKLSAETAELNRLQLLNDIEEPSDMKSTTDELEEQRAAPPTLKVCPMRPRLRMLMDEPNRIKSKSETPLAVRVMDLTESELPKKATSSTLQ
jgi:hypothetical protein